MRAVDGVSLTVKRGETLGLVGESGSGKSTLCRAILQLVEPTSGSVRFEGREIAGLSQRADAADPPRDPDGLPGPLLLAQPAQAGRPDRRRLPALRNCRRDVNAPTCDGTAPARGRVEELLERVGLSAEHYDRFPHEFSGGQRQRIGIARALALEPKLVVADEPVSALDVSIQAQILDLLADLQEDFGLSYVFVAHDIGVVRHVSDRIAVMYRGKIVEEGPADRVCERPSHPYTQALLEAVPIPDPREARARRQTVGAVTLPLSPPIKPQLALTRRELPRGEEWAYEEKLDGFRAIVFVDGEDSYIQSRGARNLSRYFPELSFPPGRYVLDGELVIRDAEGNIEFDAMQSRIHPAESRITLLSREIPASYVVFDLLAEGDESLLGAPFSERRARLEALAERLESS